MMMLLATKALFIQSFKLSVEYERYLDVFPIKIQVNIYTLYLYLPVKMIFIFCTFDLMHMYIVKLRRIVS